MENVIVKWLAHLTALNLWQKTHLSNGFRKLSLLPPYVLGSVEKQ